MTKTISNTSILPIAVGFALLFALAALPVFAVEGPTDQCTLVRDVKIKDTTYAEGAVVGPMGAGAPVTSPTADWGAVCLINTINTVVDWIFIFLLVVSAALIAVAGFMYMTAGANAEQPKKAGGMIMYAVIGIVIAILARIIPALVAGIIG